MTLDASTPVRVRPSAAPARNLTGTPTIPVGSPLLLLGRGADRSSERGVVCPGDLPAADEPALLDRALAAKAALGDRVDGPRPPLPTRPGHRARRRPR